MNHSNSDTILGLKRASQSPWYFLTGFVHTQDPARGLRAYPRYDYLRELVQSVEAHEYLLVPKSRQVMVTWTMVGYFLWRALFREHELYLFLSRNERCAEELLERARYILAHLPPVLRMKLTTNSREEIAFGGLGARILSLPATPNGPRMYSPSAVFWDEMAFTPYDEHIWSALKPALDSGGRFVGVSSSGGAHNLFARFVTGKDSSPNLSTQASPPCFSGGAGGVSSLFHLHRIHYSQHPERNNENWKRKASAGLSQSKWNQEQEISFDSASDLVYNEFDSIRHLLPAHWVVNPQNGVYRSIDFGYRHPFVLWFQRAGDDEFVIFDEWDGRDATTEQMLAAIQKIDLKHGLHERDVNWTSCDPAGAAVQDAGISPVDTLRRAGIKLRYRSSRVEPGIQRVKAAFCDVRNHVALRVTQNCVKLISDLSQYRWSSYGNEPEKDGIVDHSMDALRYFFVNLESPDEMLLAPRIAGLAR